MQTCPWWKMPKTALWPLPLYLRRAGYHDIVAAQLRNIFDLPARQCADALAASVENAKEIRDGTGCSTI